MSEPVVVDASVALKWVTFEADSERALHLKGASLFAPDLLLAECGNALWWQVRTGAMRSDEAALAVAELVNAPLTLVPTATLIKDAYRLAVELDRTVYDCVYLALAVAQHARLVTADRRFQNAITRHRAYRESVVMLDQV